MKNIEITKENVNIYEKLLNVKEGKLFLNRNSVLIPSLLFIIETLILINVFVINPFINIGTETINGLIRLILFGGCFYVSAKLNLSFSKMMAIAHFKKDYPEIDTDIDIALLKQLLNEYRQIKRFNDNKYLDEVDEIIPVIHSARKMSLEEQKTMLQKESDFLKHSEDTSFNHDSKGYQKRIK